MPKISKSNKIKKRLAGLRKIYANLPEEKKSIAEPLIKNAAFMEAELDELQQIIAENGASE